MKITEKQKQRLNSMCVVAEEVKLGDIIAELKGGTSTEVQADWNETNADSPAYIKNKPDISKEEVEAQATDIVKLNTETTLMQGSIKNINEDLSIANTEISVLKNTSAGKKEGNKEVFNDYENNVSNTILSHVEGTNNKSRIGVAHVEGRNNNQEALMGFKIVQKNDDLDSSTNTASAVLDSVDYIQVGDTWNVFTKTINGVTKHRGKIKEVNTEDKKVTLDVVAKDWDFKMVNPSELSTESPIGWFFVNGGRVGTTEVTDNSGDFTTHAEGSGCTSFFNSHAEGFGCTALAYGAHAEGYFTEALGERAHAENYRTKAIAHESHAEGMMTITNGYSSHTEGLQTETLGYASHAENLRTKAKGDYTHSEGENTIASGRSQHVEGAFNIEDTNDTYLHIRGNGKSESFRSNAMTVDWHGNGWFAGEVTVGEKKYKLISEEKVGQIESLLTQDKTTLVAVIKDLQDRITALENK